MSPGSEADFDESPPSGNNNGMPVLVASTNPAVEASTQTPSPPVDSERLFRFLQLRKDHTGAAFGYHICRESLTEFFWPNSYLTALVAYLCTAKSHDRDCFHLILLSCSACMHEVCVTTTVEMHDFSEDALWKSHVPPTPGSLASAFILEAVFRGTEEDIPSFDRYTGSLAEFPAISLALCRCVVRPLYAAVFFGNAQMLSALLRFGAEVRTEDACRCQEPRRMHPLLRVYEFLISLHCDPTGAILYYFINSAAEINFVRCHQLAALVMPCDDVELRNACYTVAKAFTPPAEYETLLREKTSLRHLCRLAIRAALARRRAMPKGVEQLPLAKRLQSYILYQHGPGSV